MIAVLEKELKTFEANKDKLLVTAEGRYALVIGDQVIGTYATQEDAINEGYCRGIDKPFLVKLIQRVEPTHFYFASYSG